MLDIMPNLNGIVALMLGLPVIGYAIDEFIRNSPKK